MSNGNYRYKTRHLWRDILRDGCAALWLMAMAHIFIVLAFSL